MDPRTANMLAERARTGAAVRAATDAKKWVKTHKSAARVALAAVIVGVLVAYDVTITRPELQRVQAMLDARAADRVRAEVSTREVSLDQCLTETKTESDARWAKACKASRQRVGCSLTGPLTEALERREGEARNACLKQFSLTMQDR